MLALLAPQEEGEGKPHPEEDRRSVSKDVWEAQKESDYGEVGIH